MHRLPSVRLAASDARFAMVMAPYGILQSLLCERDLTDARRRPSRAAARGTFGLELVADLPSWEEYGSASASRAGAAVAAARTSRSSRPCARIGRGA